jgi:gas vesicle protein
MADGYDRFENEGSGGGSFVMGLLTGTVLGAGLGMLFAPKSGSALRNQISEQAGNIANQASDGYRRASETAGDWADRGREMYDKARDAVSRGAEEAQRYVRDAANTVSGSTPATSSTSASTSGSSYGAGSSYSSGPTSSDSMRGSSSESTPRPAAPRRTS